MRGTCPWHPAVTLQLEPWRPLGAEPAHEARQALGEGQGGHAAESISVDPTSFLLSLYLLDD